MSGMIRGMKNGHPRRGILLRVGSKKNGAAMMSYPQEGREPLTIVSHSKVLWL